MPHQICASLTFTRNRTQMKRQNRLVFEIVREPYSTALDFISDVGLHRIWTPVITLQRTNAFHIQFPRLQTTSSSTPAGTLPVLLFFLKLIAVKSNPSVCLACALLSSWECRTGYCQSLRYQEGGMGQIEKLLDKRIGERCRSSSPGVALLALQGGMEAVQLVRGVASVETGTPISIHSCFDAGSIAKTVTGICIALLEDEGALSLGATVRKFLPELPESVSSVNLNHLLRHESGLHNYSTMLYYMFGWHPHNPPTSEDVLDSLCRAPGPKWSPGSRYEYADTNYFLLARIVERITELPFGVFARKRLFEPLHMRDSYMTDAAGLVDAEVAEGYAPYPIALRSPREYRTAWEEGHYPVGLCYRHVGAEGFRTSVTDLARLGREVLAPSIVDADTMARIVSPSRVRVDGVGYGYGLNIGRHFGQAFLGHNGMIQGFTASVSAFPEHDLVIACLTNREDLGAWGLRDLVLSEFFGLTPPAATSVLRLSGRLFQPRSGLYLNRDTASFVEITREEGVLHASVNGESPRPIEYKTEFPAASQREVETVVVHRDGRSRSFEPFVGSASELQLDEYAGDYACEMLQAGFTVSPVETGVRLTNIDPKRPSMDLDYSPTIRDFFWSHDPHPGISQLEFLRESGRVVAFRYRDYDGDRREVFVFKR